MTTTKKRIVFSGYAHVHFLCYLPVYERLRQNPDVELFLSGGFRSKNEDGSFSFDLTGYYDSFPVDRSHIIPLEQALTEEFDVGVAASLSAELIPPKAEKTVQIFHGVSFKNLLVREKALNFDVLCLPGRYHAELFDKRGLMRKGAAEYLVTGFPKSDAIVQNGRDPLTTRKELGFADVQKPTILFAPTGEKHNALDTMGKKIIRTLAERSEWNLMVKPHDHPKKNIDWFSKLAPLENETTRVVRDRDIVPYLQTADLLLTDASSVAVEYTLLDRPIVFIDVPELMQRIGDRAPALDLETYGRKIGAIAESHETLAETIVHSLQNPDEQGAVRRDMASHIFHQPGGAADRVAKVILHTAGLQSALPEAIDALQPNAR